MKDSKFNKLEDFVLLTERTLEGVIRQSQLLSLKPVEKKVRDRAVVILQEKLDKLKKADTVDEVKSVLRVKKIVSREQRT